MVNEITVYSELYAMTDTKANNKETEVKKKSKKENNSIFESKQKNAEVNDDTLGIFTQEKALGAFNDSAKAKGKELAVEAKDTADKTARTVVKKLSERPENPVLAKMCDGADAIDRALGINPEGLQNIAEKYGNSKEIEKKDVIEAGKTIGQTVIAGTTLTSDYSLVKSSTAKIGGEAVLANEGAIEGAASKGVELVKTTYNRGKAYVQKKIVQETQESVAVSNFGGKDKSKIPNQLPKYTKDKTIEVLMKDPKFKDACKGSPKNGEGMLDHYVQIMKDKGYKAEDIYKKLNEGFKPNWDAIDISRKGAGFKPAGSY